MLKTACGNGFPLNIPSEIPTGGGGGSGDYPDLTNKPKINNVTLLGEMTAADLGLASADIEDLIPSGASSTNKLATADDIPDAVIGNPSGGTTAGDLTKLQIGDDVYNVPSGGSVPTSMSYTTAGLSYTNCSYVSGGYFTIGNIVFVNMRVKCTDGTAITMSISGFPTYNNKTEDSKNIVAVYGYNMTSETNVYVYGAIGGGGVMGIKASSLTANDEYTVSCFYLKD